MPSALAADFYSIAPDVWDAAGTPAFAPFVGKTVEVQGTFTVSSGDADVTVRWSGIALDNGDKISCLNSATADTELAVLAERGDIRNEATITGTIQASATILGFFPTIWLEDGCSITFRVPLLTDDVIASAPLVTLNDAELDFIGFAQLAPNEIRASDGAEEIVFRNHWVYPDDVASHGPTYLLTSARENPAATALQPRLETAWANGGEGMAFVAIFEETKRSIAHDVLTRGFLTEKFQAALAVSTPQTIYQPAIDIVTVAYKDLAPLGEADKRAARALLHSVITQADSRRAEGTPPAPVFMYNWIDPDYVAP